MGILPGLHDDCKAIAVNRLCVLNGMPYFHNSYTGMKPTHRHLVSYFTTNPTWFKGSSSWIVIATWNMLVWQDNSHRPKKTFCGSLPTKSNNTWRTGTKIVCTFAPLCSFQHVAERCWVCIFQAAEVRENCWGLCWNLTLNSSVLA